MLDLWAAVAEAEAVEAGREAGTAAASVDVAVAVFAVVVAVGYVENDVAAGNGVAAVTGIFGIGIGIGTGIGIGIGTVSVV